MSEFESQSPSWWDADEPLPLEVLDAIRVADREDGDAEQVARLEARLAPLLQNAPGSEPISPKAASPSSGSLSALKIAAAGVALLGAAALVWRQQPVQHSQRALVSKTSEELRAPAPRVESLPQERPAKVTSLADTVAMPAVADVAHESPASARAVAAREPNQGNSLAIEARLLSRARRSLENAPEQALALAELHQRRFPHGVLSEEREAIAIQALRRGGQEAEASQRQRRFLAKYPQSPHALSLTAGARP